MVNRGKKLQIYKTRTVISAGSQVAKTVSARKLATSMMKIVHLVPRVAEQQYVLKRKKAAHCVVKFVNFAIADFTLEP